MNTKKLKKSIKLLSNLLLLANCLLLAINGFSQGAAINTTGSNADASAILDVSSSNAGMLIPRMTTAERDAISNPAVGLQIFNTTNNCFEFFAYNMWQKNICGFNCGVDVIIDTRDGNIYNTVKIGNQCWMKENLKFLPSVSGPSSGSDTAPYYYVYNYDGTDINAAKSQANYSIYGVIYNWAATMAGLSNSSSNPSGVKGACPTGWHVPSDNEWIQLELFLGMNSNVVNNTGWRGIDEGTKLKSNSGWNSGGNGSNTSGFTALPGGYRNNTSGNFSLEGLNSGWWSTTENITTVWKRSLEYNYNAVHRGDADKARGYYIRCVKD